MRLLYYDHNARVDAGQSRRDSQGWRFEEHPDEDERPCYAILSHTWGSNDQEITYNDIERSSLEMVEKTGYKKLEFCAELIESLSSMYQWYQNATLCYVYLKNLLPNRYARDATSMQSTWDAAFRQHRWFTMGWTLQELLAPSSMKFYAWKGSFLGNKRSASMQELLSKITGVPVAAL